MAKILVHLTHVPFPPALLAAGIAWIVRAGIGLYNPDYWNPRTPLDYAAAIGTSTALVLTVPGIWGVYRHHPAPSGCSYSVWRWSIYIACISALTLGISNFIEDAFHVEGLGYVWVVGILALTAGLLIAGLSAFWLHGFSRWVGVLFLIAALGLLFTETNGWFGVGVAFIALSYVHSFKRGLHGKNSV